MKNLWKIALATTIAVVLLIVSAGVVSAQANTGTQIKGTITAIDQTATPPTVTVKPEEGNAVVLKVDSATVITETGVGTITVSNLAVNDKVTAMYDPATLVANSVTVNIQLGERQSFEGIIKSIASPIIVVTTKKGDETFQVGSATVYKVPGVTNATLSNFAVGNKVSVSTAAVTVNNVSQQMAQRMTLIPARPVKTSRIGTVTAYTSGSSITIQDKKGNNYTFIITGDTKLNLNKGVSGITIGDRVKINAQRDPSVTQFTAKTIRDFGIPKAKNNHGTQKSNENNNHGNTNAGNGNGRNNKNK